MADVAGITVDIRDLSAAFGRLGGAVDDAIGRALLAGGLMVEGAAKMNIIETDFIDTGATLNSTQARRGDSAAEVEIGPATEYAIFGELGIGQSEKRFMRDALEETQTAVMDAVRAELKRAIQGAAT